MSDTDSFIDEVTEELRRDKLFALMRKYGWIAILCVLLLVGGAAFVEYRRVSERAAAETLGDSLLAALQNNEATDRFAALSAISAEGDAAALVGLLQADVAFVGDDIEKSKAALEAIILNQEISETYRQLAQLKLVMLLGEELSPAERIARLSYLNGPGAPFRLLAEEQIAIAEIAKGDTAAAVDRLNRLRVDGEASQDLRRRASQLIVALGGDL